MSRAILMTDKALLTTDQQEVGIVYCSYHFVENTSCIQWNLRKCILAPYNLLFCLAFSS